MINLLFNGFLSFITNVLTFLLTPINLLLETLVPDLSTVVSTINQFWALLSEYTRFVLSYSGIYSTNITIIIILLVANITIPWTVHGIKLVAKWWEVLV